MALGTSPAQSLKSDVVLNFFLAAFPRKGNEDVRLIPPLRRASLF